MRIALTGATGFLGRYMLAELCGRGDTCRAWHRPASDRSGLETHAQRIEWFPGSLDRTDAFDAFCDGCDALVHAALSRAGGTGFRAAAQTDFAGFVRDNLLGSLALFAAARRRGVARVVFISTCAVHEVILDDRPLDETHPLWPTSHYGAHKAAIEKFVHSFGLGEGWSICALRPTGIYGLAHPPSRSRWFDLVRRVCAGQPVRAEGGGKEVHVADVARAAALLLGAPEEAIRGQAFNCCDQYVAEWTVAQLAREISGSAAVIEGTAKQPKNQIDTTRLRALGMRFGGEKLLHETIAELVKHAAR